MCSVPASHSQPKNTNGGSWYHEKSWEKSNCITLQVSKYIRFDYIDPAVDAEELAGLVV